MTAHPSQPRRASAARAERCRPRLGQRQPGDRQAASADDRPRRTMRRGARTTRAGRRAGRRRRRPGRPGRPRPGRGSRATPGPPRTPAASTSTADMPAAVQQQHLLGGEPVRDAAARVGADVDRHARLVRRAHHLREAGRAGRACAWRTRGTSPRPASAMPPNVSMLIIVGTSAVPRRAISSIRSTAEPGAVLDRVDAGPDQGRDADPRRSVCTAIRAPAACAAATAPARRGRRPRSGRGRRRPGRSSRRPASPSRCRPRACSVTSAAQLVGRHLDPDVAQVPPRRRDVPAGAGQSRHVAGRRPARGTGTANRRRGSPAPRRPGRSRPARGPRPALPIGRAARRDADVAVRVDQSGQDEPAVGDGLAPRPPGRTSPGRRPARGRGPRRRAAPRRARAAPDHGGPAGLTCRRAAS